MDADAKAQPLTLAAGPSAPSSVRCTANAATTAPAAESNTARTESPEVSMTRPRLASTWARNTDRAASSAASVPSSSISIDRE